MFYKGDNRMAEETLQSIKTKLWAMANELRGNMDASEYKNYILAFMFYRYLSEHQEQYLVKNKVLDIPEEIQLIQLIVMRQVVMI